MFKRKRRDLFPKKRRKTKIMIKQYVINEIIYSFRMSDLISKFVILKRLKSGDCVGRCPFCTPKTFNNKHFRVADRKGTWKCFECGHGGMTSIGFIKVLFDINFTDALMFSDKLMNGDKARKYFSEKEIEKIPRAKKNTTEYSDEDLPF